MGEDVIIGGSAVSLEDAQRCFTEGADYVGFGPVYPTSSKPDASSPTGIELMKKAIKTVPLPGAYGIAVISAVCCHTDPKKATQMLSQALSLGK
jgi:thiamine-phosphate pyrophosphorylase